MTHLDFAILGLIYRTPSTGYEVRKVFETTAMGNYSSSPGSIYPALKRLQKLKLLTQKKDPSGRKLFFLNKRGEKALKDWLKGPVEYADIAKKVDILLLRFAFMEDLVEREEIIKFLESFRDKTKIYLKELKEFHSAGGQEMKQHGRLAFEYGIESYQTTLRWITKTLKTIK